MKSIDKLLAYRLVGKIATFICLVFGLTEGALAQWQPTKPIHAFMGFATGGSAEALLRGVTEPLRDRLKQPIIIEARPGSGLLVAADAVVKLPPDGYSIFFASSTLVVSPILTGASFDLLKELVPVIYIGETSLMLAVHPDVPAQSLPEFIRYLKANPGKLSFGFAGNGSSMQMAGELIKARAGVDMIAVPYKGSSQLLPDLLAGRISVAVDPITTIKPHVDAGKLRVLAVTNAVRSPQFPNVPTVAEQGYENFSVSPWSGFFVRAGTSSEIVNTLNREINSIIRTPAFSESMGRIAGMVPRGGTPEQFAAMLRQDIEQTKRIIQGAGIKAE